MKAILDYLIAAYDPHTIILYGSYADGSNSAGSDFDALIITDRVCAAHDGSIMDHIPLDVFIYHTSAFDGEVDYSGFAQLHDGAILLDTRGMGRKLRDGVLAYMGQLPPKSDAEKRHQVEWCEKMLLRAARNDAEGAYRWHWLLTESLEIYFDLCGLPFLGPKKALAAMRARDERAFACYSRALLTFEYGAAEEWVRYLRARLDHPAEG